MLKDFLISASLKNSYRVNSVIYSLKQVPLLKKALPKNLYSSKLLKCFSQTISVIWELISIFLGKILYLILMITLPSFFFKDIGELNVNLHILFFLTIMGATINTYMFSPTKDKYYAMFIMRMDAKSYTLSNYIYSMLKVFIGFLPLIFIGLGSYSLPLWVPILISVFIVSAKVIVAWLILLRYAKTKIYTNENLPAKFAWPFWITLFVFAYGLPILNVLIPIKFFLAIAILTIIISIYAIFYIAKFNDYRNMYQQLLFQSNNQMTDYTEITVSEAHKKISADSSITSNKHGFEYFNEIFILRHKKVLWKPAIYTTFISLVVILIIIIVLIIDDTSRLEINSGIITILPSFIFIMYFLNRGTQFTEALFINCDHSMLTYSFYKDPKAILQLFSIRLREIIKVNLLPAFVIGTGLSVILYLSGGTDNYINYFILFITIIAISVFFSVHYLTCYYLLQPYNANTEIKSFTYSIVTSVTYFLTYFLSKIKVSTFEFGMLTIAFCIIYSILASILVYKFAPKTFRIRY